MEEFLKKDIRSIEFLELREFLESFNEKEYKSKQIFEWIWKKSKTSFDSMSNISTKTKNILKQEFCFKETKIKKIFFSKDGTVKFLFVFHDGKTCEGVLIPKNKRFTACISSQVGCSLDCSFCATGKMKLERNLMYQEIYDQIYLINKTCLEEFSEKVTNIVYMGMGEPFLNYQNVVKSIEKITSKQYGLGMSEKRITVSTSGISKIIKKFANEDLKVNLALSLHSVNDKTRTQIMSINKTNNLKELKEALMYFYKKTKIKPTLEYILLKDINDKKEDIQSLILFCKQTPSKVNFIEYNEIEKGVYTKTPKEKATEILKMFDKNKITAKFRQSRGEDINAACGQLATKNK
tara:strand:+ start:30 stop:1079 length:1050 start_codon:yes stop_codon:yes gene_type:complete